MRDSAVPDRGTVPKEGCVPYVTEIPYLAGGLRTIRDIVPIWRDVYLRESIYNTWQKGCVVYVTAAEGLCTVPGRRAAGRRCAAVTGRPSSSPGGPPGDRRRGGAVHGHSERLMQPGQGASSGGHSGATTTAPRAATQSHTGREAPDPTAEIYRHVTTGEPFH